MPDPLSVASPARSAACAAALALLLQVQAGEASAQSTLTLEGRAGVAVPTGSFAEGRREGAEVGAGASFGLALTYRASDRVVLDLGFGQLRFDCERDGCVEGGRYLSTGWELGGRIHLRTEGVRPWLRAGAVIARVERDALRGVILEGGGTAVSDLALGGVAGLGVTFPVTDRIGVGAETRYTLLNTRFPDRGLLRMRHVTAELGLRVGF